MLGISRYDPSAAAASTSTSKDASSTAEQQAERLRALKDQIAARKRKREQDDEQERTLPLNSNDKGKQRAVSFSVAGQDESPANNVNDGNSLSSPAVKQQPTSILKPSKTPLSQPTKEKTTAKKKYLKRKLERKKAKKRSAGKNGISAAGDDASSVVNGDGGSDGSDGEHEEAQKAQETPDERKARKKALKEARRTKTEASMTSLAEDTAVDGVAEAASEAAKQAEKEERKKARQAKKAAKAASKAAVEESDAQDVTMQDVEASERLISTEVGTAAQSIAQPASAEANETKEEEFTRREKLMLAKLAELKTKQAKQNQKAEVLAKAAAKAKAKGLPISAAAALNGQEDEEMQEEEAEDDEPTQKNVLPRFPAPERAVVPSQKELDALAISHELREAILIDQNDSVPISSFTTEQDPSSTSPILSSQMQERLKEAKMENFFAVQKSVLPILLEDNKLYAPFDPPRDLCVSAPTGSGKTLSYVIPIVEVLSKRIVTRLRALVVLPTRDLVVQVKDVFEQFAKGTGLKVGTATGQHSFAHEQNSLIEDTTTSLAGGSSKVDILIVTPGRLIDHLKSTPNFSLQHLRYLVIDEADRLLNQSFNDWLTSVLGHIERTSLASQQPVDAVDDDEDNDASRRWISRGFSDPIAPVLMNKSSTFKTDIDVVSKPSTQKLLFSATLTRDPARVAALHLYKPVYLAVVDRSRQGTEADGIEGAGLLDNEREYVLPSTLKETMLTIPTFRKPLLLLHLLYTLQLSNVLCFTKSVESAGRLVLLLEAFNRHSDSLKAGQLRIANYTSELQPSQRKTILEDFTLGKIQILICSDLIARGMDLPSVKNVVNYDVPIDMRKYVHRVGRTARAGREGHAWSLVESQEAAYFKGLLKEAKRYELVKKVKVKKEELDIFEDAYEAALLELRE